MDSYCVSETSDTYFITSTKTEIENRYSHTSVFWGGSIYIFGGSTLESGKTCFKNSIIQINLDENEWKFTGITGSNPKPKPRRGHTACVLNNMMYIWGGQGSSSQLFNDMWIFKFETEEWYEVFTIGEIPSARYYHSCTIYDSNIWIYGGYNGNDEFSDMYSYNPGDLTWKVEIPSSDSILNPPSKQLAYLACYQDKLFLIGGSNPLEDEMLDIYIYIISKGIWYFQNYEFNESNELENELNEQNEQNKIDLGKNEIISKRNRFFHSCTIVPDKPIVYIYGGVNVTIANQLDLLTFEFIENEFSDNENFQNASLTILPKEKWESAALYYHPEILSLLTRLRNLNEFEPFLMRHPISKTYASETLGNKHVLAMLMEWLALNGYNDTLERLKKDTHQNYVKFFNTRRSSSLEELVSFVERKIPSGIGLWDDYILNMLNSDHDTVKFIDHLPDWHLSQERDEELIVSPWDEKVCVKIEAKVLTFCSLNSLIETLVNYPSIVNKDASKEEIDEHISCFFHTYHCFSPPMTVLEKLVQFFDIPKGTSLDGNSISKHKSSVLYLIIFWIEICSWDWIDEGLVTFLKSFIDGPFMSIEQKWITNQLKQSLIQCTLGSWASPASNNIKNSFGKLTIKQLISMQPLPGTQKTKKSRFIPTSPPDPIVPKTIFSPRFKLKQVSEIELARQITIIQFSIFCMIKPNEWLNSWLNSDELHYKSAQLTMFIKRSESVKNWILESISECKNNKKRNKAIEKALKIVDHLKKLKNYENSISILDAVNVYYSTLDDDSKKKLDSLNKHMEKKTISNNFANPFKPCIPIVKFILNDIRKIEGEAELINNPVDSNGKPLINFHKCRKIYSILRSIISIQSNTYNLLPVYQIASILKSPEVDHSYSLRITIQPK